MGVFFCQKTKISMFCLLLKCFTLYNRLNDKGVFSMKRRIEEVKKERANYSLDFKLKVLADMYENGLSIFGAAKKFGIKNHYSVDYRLCGCIHFRLSGL